MNDFNGNTFMEVPHLFKQVTEVHYFKWLETVMLSLLGCVFDFNFCKGADEVDLTKRVHPFCVFVSNTYTNFCFCLPPIKKLQQHPLHIYCFNTVTSTQ